MMVTRQASRQPSLGISSVVTWRGRPWISSVDTWRGRPPAPADTAHRTACTQNSTQKYMTQSFYPRSVSVASWQWCNEPSHSRWVGAMVWNLAEEARLPQRPGTLKWNFVFLKRTGYSRKENVQWIRTVHHKHKRERDGIDESWVLSVQKGSKRAGN
jgi:hypothetical protein